MFKLTVNIEEYNNYEVTNRKEVRGVFSTIEAAQAEARREIIRLSEEDNTDVEIRNHLRSSLLNCGSVFQYNSKDSIDFKEVRHYWAEKVTCCDKTLQAAMSLYEDKCAEKEYPELNAMLLKFITDKLEK